MKVGDLVLVSTKYEGKKPALVISQHFSAIGVEWKVKRLDSHMPTICQSCDLEMVSAGR